MRNIIRFGSRTIMIYIASALVVGLAVGYFVISLPQSIKLESQKGVLDLSQVHVSEHPLKLEGEWEFYWHELLSPEDIQERAVKDDGNVRLINIPNSWLGYQLDDQRLNGTGFATFRLLIELSDYDKNEKLALLLPTIFHSYKLWINGELLSESGIVGEERLSVLPHLETKLLYYQPDKDRLELVLQVANFHHKRGGITKSIELGSSEMLMVRKNLKITAEMFIAATLLVIGLYHLMLFVLRRKDRAPLYFGLFSLLFGIRSFMVGEYMITQLWPNIPWGLQFKVEYLILSSGAYLVTMYFISIFPNYVSAWFYLGTRVVTSVLCLIVLVTPAIVYTQMLLIIGVIVVIHVLYLIVGLVHEAKRRMEGAINFLIVSVVVLIATINDFLYYSELSPIENLFPIGLLVFTIGQMVFLSSRFTRAAANEERIARELQDANLELTNLNTNLELIVQERTHALSIANSELRKSYDQLLQSEQGRKKLLAYITHDLRMPLSSMLGYVEAVQDRVKPERNEQYLKYIRDNTIRINRMIEELSFLSHLETGQVSYRMESVHVVHFLRDFYEQYELVVRDVGLEFILDVNEVEGQQYLPIVQIDEQRLDKALFNIVSNAMKFTSKGGAVRIGLAVDEVEQSRYAIISIKDSGMGIPPEQLEKIFDRNYKYDRPGMDKGIEGTGLGLAICREIVQSHGGTVRAESDGQNGSVFYVSLPIR